MSARPLETEKLVRVMSRRDTLGRQCFNRAEDVTRTCMLRALVSLRP